MDAFVFADGVPIVTAYSPHYFVQFHTNAPVPTTETWVPSTASGPKCAVCGWAIPRRTPMTRNGEMEWTHARCNPEGTGLTKRK